ncbi:MAG: FAD-binding oxidoreductase [Aquihabitans sp.]
MASGPGSALPARFLNAATDVLGGARVLLDPEVTVGYGLDWTGRFRSEPPAVLRPSTVGEVAAIVAAARTHGVALVPQGGNTGLVGGATPCDGEVVVDLRAMDHIGEVDATGGQVTVGAGVVIARLQEVALRHGWAYGVDWGARDSATVGGSVATNAGGLRFVRHRGTRQQLLGVEAVLGSGLVIHHLPEVDKDNTGYDLAGLMCGSEGTLGIITAARFRLVPPPPDLATAMVGFFDTAAAVAAASLLRRSLAGLEAVELMTSAGVTLVSEHLGLAAPLASSPPAILLIETGDSIDPMARLAEAVAGLDGVADVAVAADDRHRARLWRYREGHTEAINGLGPPHKFDVTIPAGALAEFIDVVPALVATVAPDAQVWCFGHAADGNVHVNVTGLHPDDEAVAEVVLTLVADVGGSISAEHGIGRAKQRWISLTRSAADLATMRTIRAALDPDGICNPGVL